MQDDKTDQDVTPPIVNNPEQIKLDHEIKVIHPLSTDITNGDEKLESVQPVNHNVDLSKIYPQLNDAPTESSGVKESNKPQQTKDTPKKKLILGTVLGIFSLVIISILALGIFYLPKKTSENFIKKSQPIMKELVVTTDDFKNKNFMEMQNTTTDFVEARKLLKQHQEDLSETKSKIKDLEGQFNDLNSSRLDKEMHEKYKKAFELANSMIEKYEQTLVLRRQIFDAYGKLPDHMGSFNEIITQDALISEVAQISKTTKEEADLAIEKMGAIKVLNQDDQDYYQNKLFFLKNTSEVFSKLYGMLIAGKYTGINELLTQYKDDNYKGVAEVEEMLKKYVTDSKVAELIKEFEQLDLPR